MPTSAQDFPQRKSSTVDKAKSLINLAFCTDCGIDPWKRGQRLGIRMGAFSGCNPIVRKVGIPATWPSSCHRVGQNRSQDRDFFALSSSWTYPSISSIRNTGMLRQYGSVPGHHHFDKSQATRPEVTFQNAAQAIYSHGKLSNMPTRIRHESP